MFMTGEYIFPFKILFFLRVVSNKIELSCTEKLNQYFLKDAYLLKVYDIYYDLFNRNELER